MTKSSKEDPAALARRLLSERRTKMRFPSELCVTCRAGGGRTGIVWAGRVRDISLKGIGILLPRQFSAGSVLTVKLHHEQGPILMTGQARVVFVRPDNAGYLHGCQLTDRLSEEQLEALLHHG